MPLTQGSKSEHRTALLEMCHYITQVSHPAPHPAYELRVFQTQPKVCRSSAPSPFPLVLPPRPPLAQAVSLEKSHNTLNTPLAPDSHKRWPQPWRLQGCTFSVSVQTWMALGMSRAVFSLVIEQISFKRTVSCSQSHAGRGKQKKNMGKERH